MIYDLLKQSVDEMGVSEVLIQLADVCSEKADKLKKEDPEEAGWWDTVSNKIEELAEDISAPGD